MAASVLSGLLLFACFPRLDWHLLVWVSCLPLLAAVASEPSLLRGFFWGYLTGAIFLTGSCYWFVGVMKRYGGLGTTLAVGIMALFLVVFAAFFGVFGMLEAFAARRSRAYAFLLSPFLWVALELARTYLITGFPWNLLGYGVEAAGLRQLASYTAVYGLSFLAVSTAALLAWTILEPWHGWVRTSLALWFASLLAANWVATPPASVPGRNIAYLVQPNVPLDEAALERWAPWQNPAPLERLVAMTLASRVHEESASASPPLIVWPENPAPFYFNRDPVFERAMEAMARKTQAYVIAGTVIHTGSGRSSIKNSAVALDPTGRLLFEYDKIHLVPFGEYVPEWAFPGKMGRITFEVGNYVPGTNYLPAETPEGAIGIFICYEAIFPQLVRRLTARGPGVLVNISDDGWYGESSAPYQHLAMARMRAIENRRFLLRATNDGITAVIDPYGRVMEQLPRHRLMVLPGHFNYLSTRTFYAARGDVFAWMCVVLSAVILGVRAAGGKKELIAES